MTDRIGLSNCPKALLSDKAIHRLPKRGAFSHFRCQSVHEVYEIKQSVRGLPFPMVLIGRDPPEHFFDAIARDQPFFGELDDRLRDSEPIRKPMHFAL